MRINVIILLWFIASTLNASDSAFTIVELFTSEGCSSCPPADAAVNNLIAQAREKKLPVYALAFHVDYWDALNTPHGVWKDPFSNNIYTRYQKDYANKKPIPGRAGMMVTPQILVDGAHLQGGQFNPQQRLAIKREHSIDAKVEKDNGEFIAVYTCSEVPADSVICIALVERGLNSKITAGENHGKELVHDNVVRDFHRLPLKVNKGMQPLQMPADLIMENCSVFFYLQNNNNMDIFAASKVDAAAFTDLGTGTPLKFECKDGTCTIPIDQVPDKE